MRGSCRRAFPGRWNACPSFRHREPEGRALARRRMRPGTPAVTLHHAPYDGKADAVALEFGLAVQPFEGAEQLVGVAHVEAGAVVAHEIGFPRRVEADLD